MCHLAQFMTTAGGTVRLTQIHVAGVRLSLLELGLGTLDTKKINHITSSILF